MVYFKLSITVEIDVMKGQRTGKIGSLNRGFAGYIDVRFSYIYCD